MIYLSKKLINDDFKTERGGFTGATLKAIQEIVFDRKGKRIDFKKGGWAHRIDNMCIQINEEEYDHIKNQTEIYSKRKGKIRTSAVIHRIHEVMLEYKGVMLDEEVWNELMEELKKAF